MSSGKRIYFVDWQKLITWLTPPEERKTNTMQWLNGLLSPLGKLHLKFLRYRKYANYQLAIGPEVYNLERALNDRYDYTLRRIVIVDGAERNPLPLFVKTENKPVVLRRKIEGPQKVLYTKGETAQFTVDFVVKIPVMVPFEETELRAFLSGYIVAKTFQIMIV